MGEPEEYSEEFFAARIETLQNQIKEALPTLESSEAMKEFQQDCQVQWDAWVELRDLRALIDKKKGDEKNQLKKEKKQKDNEYTNLLKETWPERIKTGAELFNTDVDLAALETVIMECTVLVNSEPKRLAEFIAESWKHKSLWDEFVSDPAYMKKVLVNGGAHSGLIHKALKLHKDLRGTIKNDPFSEIRENLALAVALEFAVPKSVFKHDDQFLDPIERFWHYVSAFERGELDKHFETLSVWELRMVVDCDATNEDLQWGRDYLKRYRPDQVRTPCPRSKYLWSGRTDTSGRPKLHEFLDYKEVLSAGGPCGPNAFWGRFIIKTFGLPTWGVKQPGHAAISRWYPEGCWGTELGMSFILSHWPENRWAKIKHQRRGEDFDYDSRARIHSSADEYFANVTLLECVSDCLGDYLESYIPASQVWRSLAVTQRRMVAERNWVDQPKNWQNKPMKNRGELLPTTPPKFETTESITWKSGEATIPSAIMSSPVNDKFEVYHEFKDEDFPYFPGANYRTGDINIMASWTGGNQVCYGKGDYTWEYDIPDTIPEGTYGLSCKFVNVHRTQSPLVYIVVDPDGNDSERKEIEIPYTVGEWNRTGVVLVDLKPGGKLKFSRGNGNLNTRQAGAQNLVIKEYYLKPKDQLGVDTEYVIVDN